MMIMVVHNFFVNVPQYSLVKENSVICLNQHNQLD